MQLPYKRNKKKIFFASLGLIVVCGIGGMVVSIKANAPKSHVPKVKSTVSPEAQSDSFNKLQYSITDPNSPWIIVNKSYPLNPASFVPSDLTTVSSQQVSAKAASQLQMLITSAASQNVKLRVISGFRSYGYQAKLYNSYVISDGQAKADTYSARPGHSEHQTGLAVDMGGVHGCDVEVCFGATPEGQWLTAHASEYGFLIRYTAANQSITGYQAEPWHLRYVGVELMNEMIAKNVTTLEEFFGVNGGTLYRD